MEQQRFHPKLATLTTCVLCAVAGSASAQTVPPRAAFGPAPSAAAPAPVAPESVAPPNPSVAPAPSGVPPATAPAPLVPPAPEGASAPSSPVDTTVQPAPLPSSPVVLSPPEYMSIPASHPVVATLPYCDTRATPSPCLEPPSAYHHDGFYLRISAGPHYASFTGDGKSTDVSVHGFTSASMIAIGGTPGDGVVVGGAFRAEQVRGTLHGAPKEGNATATVGQIGFFMDWFPKPSDGWHVGGLIALGVVSLSDSQLSDQSGAAFAASAFGGYDFWIGPEWSLGVMGVFSATSRATLRDSDHGDTGYELNAIAGGIDVSFVLH
jgi:hypothetical protein